MTVAPNQTENFSESLLTDNTANEITEIKIENNKKSVSPEKKIKWFIFFGMVLVMTIVIIAILSGLRGKNNKITFQLKLFARLKVVGFGVFEDD